MSSQSRSQGYTLVELMVALAAGAFLLAGVSQLNFAIDNNLVTIKVGPENLPTQFGNTIAIDIAVSNVILNNAFGGA